MAGEVWYDVYGLFQIRLTPGEDGWYVVHRRRPNGRLSPIDDLVISCDASDSEISDTIDVLFHEAAFPGAEVRLIEEPQPRRPFKSS
jgi:hypothetical protein